MRLLQDAWLVAGQLQEQMGQVGQVGHAGDVSNVDGLGIGWFILAQLVLTLLFTELAYLYGHEKGYFQGRRDGLNEYRAVREVGK